MSQRFAIDHLGNGRHMRGWKRGHHDPRDFKLSSIPENPAMAGEPALTLRSHMPAVRDQGDLGSCTANAGVVAAEFARWKQTGTKPSRFSRLDLYAMTREVEGTPLTEDSGCYVRDVCKALAKYGVCYEAVWPYDVAKFSRRPSRAAMIDALHHKATSYKSAVGLAPIKASIVDGYPLIFGFDCFESLMSESTARTGIVTMPAADEESIGGHCVTLTGYNDALAMFEFQNSWGTSWGVTGFGSLPYEYVTSGLASDFWTLRHETLK